MKYEKTLEDLHRRIVKPKFEPFGEEDIRFLSLALCGEVGEVANEIKKRWRGDIRPPEKLKEEIGDVLIYLRLLMKALKISEEQCIEVVMEKLAERYQLKRTCPYKGCHDSYSARPPCALCYE